MAEDDPVRMLDDPSPEVRAAGRMRLVEQGEPAVPATERTSVAS